jgi:hypothetical protein
MNGDNNIHYSLALPDFKWINGEIPILEVAQKVGLAVQGRKAICPQCSKPRLTFTTIHNGWKCWECEPTGKMHSVVDLVMLLRNCSLCQAAKWIGENWRVAGRVQIEYSENAHGSERQTYQRYQPIRVPDKSQPSLQALVASPGWREMPLSVKAICMTLFAMALDADDHVLSIGRRRLGELAGVHKPSTVVQAVREMEAIGLFSIDKGSWGNRGYNASTYRLTWWSEVLQAWLSQGYATPHALSPQPLSPHYLSATSITVPLGNHPPVEQRQDSGVEDCQLAGVMSSSTLSTGTAMAA